MGLGDFLGTRGAILEQEPWGPVLVAATMALGSTGCTKATPQRRHRGQSGVADRVGRRPRVWAEAGKTTRHASGGAHALGLPRPQRGVGAGLSGGCALQRPGLATVQELSQSWAPGTGRGGRDYFAGGVQGELGPLNSRVEVVTPAPRNATGARGFQGERGALPPGDRRTHMNERQDRAARGRGHPPRPAPVQSRPRDRSPDLSRVSDTEPSTERGAGPP